MCCFKRKSGCGCNDDFRTINADVEMRIVPSSDFNGFGCAINNCGCNCGCCNNCCCDCCCKCGCGHYVTTSCKCGCDCGCGQDWGCGSKDCGCKDWSCCDCGGAQYDNCGCWKSDNNCCC